MEFNHISDEVKNTIFFNKLNVIHRFLTFICYPEIERGVVLGDQ